MSNKSNAVKSNKIKHKTKVYLVMVVSFTFSSIIGTYLFDHSLKEVLTALDSILLFVSIITGFMGASISVFATVSDSKFAVKLKNSPNSKKQFINTLVSSLIIGVVLVATTIIYQLLIANNAPYLILLIIKYMWLFLIPLFLGFGYIIISVILKILFST